MKKESKMLNVLSVIIVVIIVVLIGLFIKSAITGEKNKNESSKQVTTETISNPGDTQQNAIVVTSTDLSMTGEEFAAKYSGKYVAFDGLLQGTAKIKNAPSAHTELLIGDDINKGGFADASAMWITSAKSTFSENLSQYATENSTPYETSEYPKVHVVAKVSKFSDTYSVVQLDPISNVDGKTPSITSR